MYEVFCFCFLHCQNLYVKWNKCLVTDSNHCSWWDPVTNNDAVSTNCSNLALTHTERDAPTPRSKQLSWLRKVSQLLQAFQSFLQRPTEISAQYTRILNYQSEKIWNAFLPRNEHSFCFLYLGLSKIRICTKVWQGLAVSKNSWSYIFMTHLQWREQSSAYACLALQEMLEDNCAHILLWPRKSGKFTVCLDIFILRFWIVK